MVVVNDRLAGTVSTSEVTTPPAYAVVSPVGLANYSTLQQAIDAGEGNVYVSSQIAVAAATTLPDGDFRATFAPGAKLVPSGNIEVFVVPNGLTAARKYSFEGLTVEGDLTKNQTLFALKDANSLGTIYTERSLVKGIKNLHNISAGDLTYAVPVIVKHHFGVFLPIDDLATGKLVLTAGAYAENLFGTSIYFDHCDLFDASSTNDDTEKGWSFDCDADIILTKCRLDVGGANQATGLQVEGASDIQGINGNGTDSVKGANGSYHGRLMLANSWITSLQFILDDEGFVSNVGLKSDAKIKVVGAHGAQQVISKVIQSFGNGIPDAPIEIGAGMDCVIEGCSLRRASEALIKNGSIKTIVQSNRFEATGGTKTIKDVGAGDYTLGMGNVGVSTGGGLSLGAHSKVTIGDYNFA